MQQVGRENTRPELAVRSLLHRLGYRFRLHSKKLPGSPDIVLSRHRTIILVNGCFWHGHRGCRRATRPTSNVNFWNQRLDRNICRDKVIVRRLRRLGWSVIVVWECQTNDLKKLESRLKRAIGS